MAAATDAVRKATLADVAANATRLIVADRDLLTPPGLPVEGARYLMPAAGTILGAWATEGILNNEIAWFRNGGWRRVAPSAGLQVYVQDEARTLDFSSGAWKAIDRKAIETVGDGTDVIVVNKTLDASAVLIWINGGVIYPSQIDSITPDSPAAGQSSINFSFTVAASDAVLIWG